MQKVIINSNTGGAPFYDSDLQIVFNKELWDVIDGLFSTFDGDTEGMILSGCVVSGGGTIISDGIVYLNGEFMRLPASTPAGLPFYIQPDTVTDDSRTYSDGTSHSVIETKPAKVGSSTPGSGQYIRIGDIENQHRNWSSPWIDIPLVNGWAHVTNNHLQTRYFRGKWEARGQLNSAAATNAIFCNGTSLPKFPGPQGSGGPLADFTLSILNFTDQTFSVMHYTGSAVVSIPSYATNKVYDFIGVNFE